MSEVRWSYKANRSPSLFAKVPGIWLSHWGRPWEFSVQRGQFCWLVVELGPLEILVLPRKARKP